MQEKEMIESIHKSYEFMNVSKEELGTITNNINAQLAKFKDVEYNFLHGLIHQQYILLASKRIDNQDYRFITNYLTEKKSKGRKIFTDLNNLIKDLKLEFSFDMGIYLINNYPKIEEFFTDCINYLINNKENIPDIGIYLRDNLAELLFELYCDIKHVSFNYINRDEESSPGYYSDDSLKMYYHEIIKYPLLTPQEEIELFTRLKNNNDQKARETLVNCNLRWVVKIAKQYCERTLNRVPLLDLIQEGNIGLVKAIDKFELSMGYRISTYSTWWIRQTITRYLSDKMSLVRIPVYLTEKIKKVKAYSEEYVAKNDKEPSVEELAKLTGYSSHEVLECLRTITSYGTITSLDELIGENQDTPLKEFVPSDENVALTVENSFIRDDILEVLETLTEREKDVILKRYGFIDGRTRTLDEIGKEYNLTRERIRQIEQKALRKLRRPKIKAKLDGSRVDLTKVQNSSKKRQPNPLIGLKTATNNQVNFVLSNLDPEEKQLLRQKIGNSLSENNYLGTSEEFFNKIIVPKVNQLLLRITYSTFSYSELFPGLDRRIQIENYYLLQENDQQLLKKAYGEKLNLPLNKNITFDEEYRIARIIVPRMINSKATLSIRQYDRYNSIFQEDNLSLTLMYANLFTYIYPDRDFHTLINDTNAKRTVIDGIDYIIKSVLNSEEESYIKNIFSNNSLSTIGVKYKNNNDYPRFHLIMKKLKSSPHLLLIANELSKRVDDNKIVNGEIGFYSFFTDDEIKHLKEAISLISFSDLQAINIVFPNGIDNNLYKKSISNEDYSRFIKAVYNIKRIIASNKLLDPKKDIGNQFELFRYCDYIYDKSTFIYLIRDLSKEEKQVLLCCLNKSKDINEAINHTTREYNMSRIRVIKILKQALDNIAIKLETVNIHDIGLKQEDVDLVLKLTKNETSN